MQRFFVAPETLVDTVQTGVLHEESLVHQLGRVLRAQPGDHVALLPDDGTETEVELIEIGKKEIRFRIVDARESTAEPEIYITLYQAVPKQLAKFESVLQHGTEVGISRFVPLHTARSQGHLRNVSRCEKILKEAAEQSGRGRIPELGESMQLAELVAQMPAGTTVVADSYCTKPLLTELLPQLRGATEVNIIIGPEGGLTADEIKQLTRAGALPFSLGPRVLRTETAGLAVASAMLFT